MYKRLSINTGLLILMALSGCAARTIALPECPKPPPLRAALKIPAPDPLLFQKCLAEALALTSAQSLTPSCQALSDWRSSTLTSKGD